MNSELAKLWSVTVTDEQKPELLGEIINVFENFLDEKGITPDMVPNSEREDDDSAIIYGEDYDALADQIAAILNITR